ncbi:MAG: TIGR00730 family Rossman fold protein [Alphaproteobacteria bacterium]|nr:TIGR00730 family Rossman fold protein [Alphaproteobacteria bacterium]
MKTPPRLTYLCVFCGSQVGADPAYKAQASLLGSAMAARGVALVFGGGRVGLMGACADAVLAGGGKVVGVIPEFLRDKELAHPRATEMVVVPDMHTRKRIMFERADAFCILPGGIGTLDEFFEIVTWRQLHRHNKPIVVLNTAGYWNHLRGLMDVIIDRGFAHGGHNALIDFIDRAEDVIPIIDAELAAPKPAVVFKV